MLVGSPCSLRDSQESPTTQLKSINSLVLSALYGPTLTSLHDYHKNHSFDYTDLCQQSLTLLFNTLSSFVTAILSRSKCLLISLLQSLSPVILEPKKIKSVTVSISSPSVCQVMGQDAMILVFERWVLSHLFNSPISSSLRGSLVPLHFLH